MAGETYCQLGKLPAMPDRIPPADVLPLKIHFKEWRKAAHLTLAEVAEQLGISASYLSRIENGKRDFSGRLLVAFASAVGCPNANDPIVRPPDQLSIDGMLSTVDPGRQPAVRDLAADIVQRLLKGESDKILPS